MAQVRYHLRIPEPHTHLVHVRLEVDAVAEPLRLAMPSWTPGSYLLREFPRHVQQFRAEDAAGAPLAWAKTDKNTWQIEAPPGGGRLVAHYTVYANELTVRTSHVDASHAFLNGTSVFMYVEGREREPLELQVEAPTEWHATTSLPRADGGPWCFRARGYDELADSPLEIGTHAVHDFEIEGRPHRYAAWGSAVPDAERLIRDTREIIKACSALFGGLPYDEYTFILHLLGGGRGGLEHRASCALHLDRNSFRAPDAAGGALSREYESAVALIAHEFFHVWNATRIRPKPLERYDYTRENYTRALWVAEGLTTYYTDLILRRAGLITPDRYLERLGEAITRLQQQPGRHVQTLEESSFDTWIKFYRPDAHTPNAQISYYQKGALVGLLLDLYLRERTANQRSLDDVMRALWQRYGQSDRGFPEHGEGSVEQIASELCGEDLGERFDAWLRRTEELDYDRYLAAAGLRLVERPAPAGDAATLEAIGVRLRPGGGAAVITHVLAGTPAHRAGLNAGDEILAIDGMRTDAARLAARLAAGGSEHRPMLTLARRDELQSLALDLHESPPATVLRVERVDSPPPEQDAVYRAWLGSAAGGAA